MADAQTDQLRIAVIERDLKNVKAALEAGADPNYENGSGLIYTSPFADDDVYGEIMKVLLEAGANPNQLSQYGEPILAKASIGNSSRMVEMLLKAGADPNVSYYEYQSVLDGVLERTRLTRIGVSYRNLKALCEVTNYDEVQRLKQVYPEFANQLNCQVSKADIAKRLGVVETALDRAAAKMYPELQDGVELPHVMKNVKDYVGYKNVGPGGRRRKTKKRKSGKKKTKKRK